jgi:hypothetical protein
LPFCGEPCEKIFFDEPVRYEQSRTFWQHHDGVSIEEFITRNGLLRADGKTLIAQPSLDTDRMWTLDDVAAWNWEFRDPMPAISAQLAAAAAPNGAPDGTPAAAPNGAGA